MYSAFTNCVFIQREQSIIHPLFFPILYKQTLTQHYTGLENRDLTTARQTYTLVSAPLDLNNMSFTFLQVAIIFCSSLAEVIMGMRHTLSKTSFCF